VPIGSPAYPEDLVSERAWTALRGGLVRLVDELQIDVECLLADGGSFGIRRFQDTHAFDHLPDKYLPSYDVGTIRRLLVCVVVVGWKLFDPEHEHRLCCVGEELALSAIVNRARTWLETEEEEPVDLSGVEDLAFEDSDFLTLFDPSLDGIEDTPTGEYLMMANLKLRDWFTPFNPARGDTVHPYVAPEEWRSRPQ